MFDFVIPTCFFFQQINDTKSAYNQITEQVGGQFVDDNVSIGAAFIETHYLTLYKTKSLPRSGYVLCMYRYAYV